MGNDEIAATTHDSATLKKELDIILNAVYRGEATDNFAGISTNISPIRPIAEKAGGEAHTLINAHVKISDPDAGWYTTVFVGNLLDDIYRAGAYDGRLAGVNRLREIGVTVGFDFLSNLKPNNLYNGRRPAPAETREATRSRRPWFQIALLKISQGTEYAAILPSLFGNFVGTRRVKQFLPIARNVAVFQHLPENAIRIGSASVSALVLFFGYPGVDDDSGFGVKPEEQPIPLEEFGSKPVCVLIAKGFSQAKIFAGRIVRNDIEHQFFYRK